MLLDAVPTSEAAADRLPLLVATVRTDRPRDAVSRARRNQSTAPDSVHSTGRGSWETELTGPRGIAAQRDEEWRALAGITEGKLEFVRALLAHGADPNARIVKPPQRVGFTLGGLNLVGATPYRQLRWPRLRSFSDSSSIKKN
jgi:hypothetical protein